MPIISATLTHSSKEAMDRQLAGKPICPGVEHAPGRLGASDSEDEIWWMHFHIDAISMQRVRMHLR